MGQIQIEVFQFAVFVDQQDGGTTVLCPAKGHALLIEQDGNIMPVQGGADLEVRGPGGAKLSPARTTRTTDFDKFVVNIRRAEDNSALSLLPALLDPTAPQNPSQINGRLFLKGGTLTARECSYPKWRGQYTFKGGYQHLVTDTAVFTLSIPATETFELWLNGQKALSLPDGSITRIANRDVVPGDERYFHELVEFVNLCKPLGIDATLPTTGGSIQPMGARTICLLGDF